MTMPLFRHRRGPEWWWGGRKETYGEAWLAPGRACDAPFPETERTRVRGGAGGMAAVGSGRGRKQRRAAGRRRKRRASALLQYSFTAAAVWPGEGSEGEPRARVAGGRSGGAVARRERVWPAIVFSLPMSQVSRSGSRTGRSRGAYSISVAKVFTKVFQLCR